MTESLIGSILLFFNPFDSADFLRGLLPLDWVDSRRLNLAKIRTHTRLSDRFLAESRVRINRKICKARLC